MDKSAYILSLLAAIDADAKSRENLQLTGEELRDDVFAKTRSYHDTMVVLVHALFAWGFDMECSESHPYEHPQKISRWDAMRFVRDYIERQIEEGEGKAKMLLN